MDQLLNSLKLWLETLGVIGLLSGMAEAAATDASRNQMGNTLMKAIGRREAVIFAVSFTGSLEAVFGHRQLSWHCFFVCVLVGAVNSAFGVGFGWRPDIVDALQQLRGLELLIYVASGLIAMGFIVFVIVAKTRVLLLYLATVVRANALWVVLLDSVTTMALLLSYLAILTTIYRNDVFSQDGFVDRLIRVWVVYASTTWLWLLAYAVSWTILTGIDRVQRLREFTMEHLDLAGKPFGSLGVIAGAGISFCFLLGIPVYLFVF